MVPINTVPTLENIKGSGGSIKVGTTGTIGALMTRELESTAHATTATQCSQGKPKTALVSVPCSAATPRRVQRRKSLDEASSSRARSSDNCRSPETTRKAKTYPKSSHRIPMLGSDNITLARTPTREKNDKRGTNIVEIVDIRCGNLDEIWPGPIATKLKKLGFSKLSENPI